MRCCWSYAQGGVRGWELVANVMTLGAAHRPDLIAPRAYISGTATHPPLCTPPTPPWEGSGHKATDTELAYVPVSQAYGHRHNSLSLSALGGVRGGGVLRRLGRQWSVLTVGSCFLHHVKGPLKNPAPRAAQGGGGLWSGTESSGTETLPAKGGVGRKRVCVEGSVLGPGPAPAPGQSPQEG